MSYNNSCEASLQAAPFGVLCGQKCRTPLNWSETGVRQLFGTDVVQETEGRLKIVREHLKQFSQAEAAMSEGIEV